MTEEILSNVDEREKVIVGSDGWLFLRNDTNNSVAQFVGEINLDEKSIDKFTRYLKALKNKLSCEFFFSISPTKEFVHPDKYPFVMKERSGGQPLIHEQIISTIDRYNIKYHYPVKELSEIPTAYYKTDTHWSEYGAYKTIKSFFQSNYGVNLIELASKDFSVEYVSGDLGSKLDGQEDGRLIYNFSIDEYEVFNSGLRNNGFGKHYINPMAIDQRRVLIFGDSFGFSYVKPLVLTFQEVVYLYSPAAFIEDIYSSFAPDFVILQINQRFLTNPPRYHYKLKDSPMFRKFRQFNSNEINNYIRLKSNKSKISFLKDFYLDGLSAMVADEKPIEPHHEETEKDILLSGEIIAVVKEGKKGRMTNLNYLNSLAARASTHTHRKEVAYWAKKQALLVAKERAFGNTHKEFSHKDASPIFKSYCTELIKTKLIDDAVVFAKEYCLKYPDIYFSYDLLSYVYWKTKNYEDALLESKKALRLNRQNPSLRISVIRLHIALGQVDEALHHLDIALSFPSKDKKAWLALYNDMNNPGISSDVKFKVINKIREIDPHFEVK